MKKDTYIIINKTQTKEELKKLINWFISNYGSIRTSKILDRLKELGFENSTLAGISLGINDLLIPKTKKALLKNAFFELEKNNNFYKKGKINFIIHSEKILKIWNTTNEKIKEEIIKNFRESNSINPLYIMTLSGARGNLSQVKQLVGIRGLMADSKGEIINLPIKHNFKEGLNLTEYFISCYGARKGLVDTALKTANSGYLTRRLIYVAQNLIIKKSDCKTKYKTILLNLKYNKEDYKYNKQNLIGRVLAKDLYDTKLGKIILKSGQDICHYTVNKVLNSKRVYVRSPLTCRLNTGICQLCYGWNLGNGRMVELGESIGILAAQSIGEPGTQLTMRTFHTGGIFSSELNETITAPHDGKLLFQINKEDKELTNKYGEKFFLIKKSKRVEIKENSVNISWIKLPKNSCLFVKPGQPILYKQLIAEIKKDNQNKFAKTAKLKEIKSPISGFISIKRNNKKKIMFIISTNLLPYKGFSENYKEKIKNIKLLSKKNNNIPCYKKTLSNKFQILLNTRFFKKKCLKKQKQKKFKKSNFCYAIQSNSKNQKQFITNKKSTEVYVSNNQAKLETGKFKIYWLKQHSLLTIQKRKNFCLIRKVFANKLTNKSRLVNKNATIKKNNILFYSYYEQEKTKDIVQGLPKIEQLLETRKTLNLEKLSNNPHEKLRKIFQLLSQKYSNKQAVRISIEKLQIHLIKKIQEIYKSQAVIISNKHIELIVKQMTSKVIIKEQGETQILPGEIIQLNKIEELNRKIKQKAKYEPIVLGISKLSGTSESFMSAASFQETAKILAKSAIEGKIDWLQGLKENIILSKLIPIGTGYTQKGKHNNNIL